MSPPANAWRAAGARDLAGLKELPEIFAAVKINAIKPNPKAKPKLIPNRLYFSLTAETNNIKIKVENISVNKQLKSTKHQFLPLHSRGLNNPVF